jgi:type IV pilus assembly protein PilQ
MRTLAVMTVGALFVSASPVMAHENPATGAVTSVAIVPANGRADVLIAIAGAVEVQDFVLGAPKHRIVLDFSGATLRGGQKLYDKVVRGGITDVRIGQFKDAVVRVVLDLDGSREYTLIREENGVRVSITSSGPRFAPWGNVPQTFAATAEATTPVSIVSAAPEQAQLRTVTRANMAQQSQQPRMSVTFFNADIRDVIAGIAAFSGRTIVVNGSVKGEVTAEINNQPWDVALRTILETQGLAAVEEPGTGIIKVDSYVNILAKQATEPLVTRLIPVNYARSASLRSTIEGLLSRECPPTANTANPGAPPVQLTNCQPRGRVIADTATNTLVITEVASRMESLAGYIGDLDIRTPQVQIKAKIIFVNRTEIEDMGVTYDLGSQTQFFNRLVQRKDPSTFVPIDRNGDGVPDAIGGGDNFASDITQIDIGGNALAAIANASQQVASPALSLIFSTAIGKFDLTAFLDALQEIRLADIQAEPSITTLDNREAEIVVGEQTPIRTIVPAIAAGAVATSDITFKETGIILRVTPHVTNNRMILMTLHSERSNLLPAASDLGFTFQTQRASNQLLVADGETAVIGGLTVTQVSVSKSGIPILVDLPFIGRLFGQTRTQEDKRDLLILVTPHIVDEGTPVGGAPPAVPPGAPTDR